MDGGINLHDVMSKIISFRLKFLYKVINNPNEFPIACYFLSGTLNNLFNGTFEANAGITPQFYDIIAKIYRSNNTVFHMSNYKTYYFNLINVKKKTIG